MASKLTSEELATEKRLVIWTHVLLFVGWLMVLGIMYGMSLMIR